jgi:hypothetical protein
MAEVITTLNNRRKIDKGGGKIILNLGIANTYLMKMMEP